MSALELFVAAPGFWSNAFADWPAARAAFRGEASVDAGAAAAKRPQPLLLPPAERRRVPDVVAAALEAASQAVSAADLDPATLPSVFASAHGDLSGLDALCRELAQPAPRLSPTRFHNAVHNAAAGYWCIATGCRRASSAVSAHERSFAAGLLEAALVAVDVDGPVLLVGTDGPSTPPLDAVAPTEGLLAVALVLSPRPLARGVAALTLSPSAAPPALDLSRLPPTLDSLARNALADALPLCAALAGDDVAAWRQPLSASCGLDLRTTSGSAR